MNTLCVWLWHNLSAFHLSVTIRVSRGFSQRKDEILVMMFCSDELNAPLFPSQNHYGGLDGGHYTAFCKNALKQRWYKFDDHEVTEISTPTVKSSAAYILFYSALWRSRRTPRENDTPEQWHKPRGWFPFSLRKITAEDPLQVVAGRPVAYEGASHRRDVRTHNASATRGPYTCLKHAACSYYWSSSD